MDNKIIKAIKDNKIVRSVIDNENVQKMMNHKIVRESFIIILLFIVIIFAIGILFYDSIPASQEQITSVQYSTEQNVNDVLNEIQANSGVKSNSSSSLLKSYSVNANDLNYFASDKSYESGKKDPFAENSETVEQVVTTTSKGGNVSNSQSANKYVENPFNNTQKNTVTNTTVANKTENKEKNVVKNDKVNTEVKNTIENKTESSSTTGTFFEKENSK